MSRIRKTFCKIEIEFYENKKKEKVINTIRKKGEIK